MSLIYATGFNFMNAGTSDLELRGITMSGINSTVSGIITGGLNGYGLRMTQLTNNFGYVENIGKVSLGASVSDLYFGTAFKMTVRASNVAYDFLRFYEGSTSHINLTSNADGSISVRRGANAGTVLATSATGVFLDNTWTYIEVYVKISDTVGEVIVKVNNNEVINITGQDTRNGGTGVIDSFAYVVGGYTDGFGSNGAQLDFDDTYACSSAGTVNNTFLGPVRIDGLLPDSDGATTDFTPLSGSDNFAMVDEAVPDGDTSYNTSATPGHKDIFGLSDIPTPASVTVFGVISRVRAKASDLGVVELQPSVISNAVEDDGASRFLGTSYAEYSDLFEQNPDGNVSWTDSSVNTLQIAYRIPA